MKEYHRQDSPKITFTSISCKKYEWNMVPHLDLLSDEMLWTNMEGAAELEEYEIAICYRDELIKRGKLWNKPMEEAPII